MTDAPDLTPSLVEGLRDGDTGAGALLERLYREPLVRFAWGYLGDPEEAEDAVQDVFCKVLESDAVPDRFRAWVYRIARNHCLNRLRSRKRRRDGARLATGMDVAASTAGHLTRMGDEEETERLAARLRELPPEQEEVLRLRYAEGLSRAEIAEVLDVPESTVKSRLFEATRRLRDEA